MLDDPLSLLGYAVWTLALGMWPVGLASNGFLFGACSKCCDECPDECSKCTHWENSRTLCPTPNSFAIVVGDCGTLTDFSQLVIWNVVLGVQNPGGCVEGPAEFIDVVLWEATLCDQEDKCGCATCGHQLFVRGRVGCIVLQYGTCGLIDKCDETETVDVFSGWQFWYLEDVDEPCEATEQDIQGAIAWANENIPLTVTQYYTPCDCGACCDGECEDDVAEGGCESWAGVGTACDDDPPPCGEEE